MLLDDLADYLSTSGISGTIYKGVMQETPDAAVGIYETGGIASVKAMNPNPGQAVLEQPSVQIVCRDVPEEYSVARLKAQNIFAVMDGMPTRSINGVEYKWGSARQSPFLLGRDEAGRVLIACNYDIKKALSTA